ncbi:MAG: hypothetical protein ACRDJW_12505 [Thermomicrobiales bacterium]
MSQTVRHAAVEARVRARVSAERLQEHLEGFSRLFRDSGNEDEWNAARYIVVALADLGVHGDILAFDSLFSWPLEGTLEVLAGDGAVVEAILFRADEPTEDEAVVHVMIGTSVREDASPRPP